MLYVGLSHNSRLVQSPLIDKKLPEFSLPVLQSDISADISVFPDDTVYYKHMKIPKKA